MADQDIFHTADIMKAALPFFDARNKVMLEFMMKIFDLMASLKSFNTSKNLAACGYEAGKPDLEGMLNGIRPVCNKKERDSIDKILNFFNMKRAFEMYNKMSEMMNTMQGFEGFPFGDSEGAAENVAGNFVGMNFDSIFNNADGSSSAKETPNTEASYQNDHSFESTSDSEKDKDPRFNTGGKMNDKMFEMLKAMVPPEQKATFENLSMLLNTMSYDNNSKPDDSKEQNDG